MLKKVNENNHLFISHWLSIVFGFERISSVNAQL